MWLLYLKDCSENKEDGGGKLAMKRTAWRVRIVKVSPALPFSKCALTSWLELSYPIGHYTDMIIVIEFIRCAEHFMS